MYKVKNKNYKWKGGKKYRNKRMKERRKGGEETDNL